MGALEAWSNIGFIPLRLLITDRGDHLNALRLERVKDREILCVCPREFLLEVSVEGVKLYGSVAMTITIRRRQ